MQLKISASYLAMLLAVMVLMNTYPLLVSEDLVFQSKRNTLLSGAADRRRFRAGRADGGECKAGSDGSGRGGNIPGHYL